MRGALLLALALSSPSAGAAERPVLVERSEIGFTVRMLGASVTGEFHSFRARVELDPEVPEAWSARVEVDVASLRTGEDEADAEALAPAWLHATRFPKAVFQSDWIRPRGPGRFEAAGTLTLRGLSRRLRLGFTIEDGPGGTRIARGQFTIRRTDFGIGGAEWNEGELVGDAVPVRFRITLAAPP